MAKVDIIVPLYETDETLFKRMLSSIASQTMIDNIRVIIVNDQSKKFYTSIISGFSRIMNVKYIVNDENCGAGKSRRIGLENSDSEFVMFADSDDCFSTPFAVEKFYKKITETDCDVVVGAYRKMFDDGTTKRVGFHITWVFSKIYRRKMLDKFGISFSDKRFNEDVEFSNKVFAATDKIEYIDEVMYLWQNNPTSLTRDKSANRYRNLLTLSEAYLSSMKWIKAHDCKGEFVPKNIWYDGMILCYSDYCIVSMCFPEKTDEYLKHVLPVYQEAVQNVEEFANSDLFNERFAVVMSSYDFRIPPICSVYDFLWKLAELNGEFEK